MSLSRTIAAADVGACLLNVLPMPFNGDEQEWVGGSRVIVDLEHAGMLVGAWHPEPGSSFIASRHCVLAIT